MKETSLQAFSSEMEAGLARNALDAAGIAAVVRYNGKIWDVAVAEEDAEAARRILSGREDAEEDSSGDGIPEEGAWQNAEEEFRSLRLSELQHKARGEKSAGLWGWIFLAASIAVFLLLPNRYLAVRLALGCLFLAVIQWFVWKDARNAALTLRNQAPQPPDSDIR